MSPTDENFRVFPFARNFILTEALVESTLCK